MKTNARPFLLLILLLIAAFILSVMVGNVFIPPSEIFKSLFGGGAGVEPTLAIIVNKLRLPHAVLMALVGASLAGSGAAYQGLFRNPLADPYLIGTASGAGLGAVAAMAVKWPYTQLGLMAVPMAAFLGAILSVLLVYFLARIGKTVPTTTLILSGVAVSSFSTAATSYLMINSSGELRHALVWLMGGSSMTGWKPVLGVLPYVLVGVIIILVNSYPLNVLQFGDEQAHQLGVHVDCVRRMVLIGASLATAAAVAYAGVIGFVGLVVPHLVRLIWGGDYRRLLPFSLLGGALLLLLTDVVSRTVMAPQEVPVGIITALLGAPFFLWVLKRSKSQNYW